MKCKFKEEKKIITFIDFQCLYMKSIWKYLIFFAGNALAKH